MARLRRDTALRSIQDFFKQLPPQATVEVIKVGPPPRGTDLAVKLEICAPETELRTAAPPATARRGSRRPPHDPPGKRGKEKDEPKAG